MNEVALANMATVIATIALSEIGVTFHFWPPFWVLPVIWIAFQFIAGLVMWRKSS